MPAPHFNRLDPTAILLPANLTITSCLTGGLGLVAVLACCLLLSAGLGAAPALPPGTALAALTDGGSSDGLDNVGQGEVAAPAPVAGEWQMTLPRGFRHKITLTPVGQDRYRFEPRKLVMSGTYELKGDRLIIVAPNDPRLATSPEPTPWPTCGPPRESCSRRPWGLWRIGTLGKAW